MSDSYESQWTTFPIRLEERVLSNVVGMADPMARPLGNEYKEPDIHSIGRQAVLRVLGLALGRCGPVNIGNLGQTC